MVEYIEYTTLQLSMPHVTNLALTYDHLLGWGVGIILFIVAQIVAAIFVGKRLKEKSKELED